MMIKYHAYDSPEQLFAVIESFKSKQDRVNVYVLVWLLEDELQFECFHNPIEAETIVRLLIKLGLRYESFVVPVYPTLALLNQLQK